MGNMIKLNKILQDKNLPKGCGDCVYKLYDESGDVVYAGQTRALERRLYAHIGNDIEFCYFSFEMCSSDEVNDLEAEAIVSSNAKLNKSLPSSYNYPSISKYNIEIKSAINQKIKAIIDELGIQPKIVFKRSSSKFKRSNVTRKQLDEHLCKISKIQLKAESK